MKLQKIILLGIIILLAYTLGACSKPNGVPTYITADQFIGTAEQYEGYKAMFFAPYEDFVSWGQTEHFKEHVENINSPTMQQGYLEYLERMEAAKKNPKPVIPRKRPYTRELQDQPILESDQTRNSRGMGFYPNLPGDILVTDEPLASGSGFAAGHAGIVQDASYTIESFPLEKYGQPAGVQKHRNDWQTRYLGSNVYGVMPHPAFIDKNEDAAKWAYAQIGKPYNFNFASFNTDEKFYCSQLVYRAYKNAAQLDLSNNARLFVSPMDLVNSPKTNTVYKR